MTLQPGDTIGAYRVIRLLGKGGMGAVYEVEHVELGTRVALKVFAREHGDVASLRRRFRTEGMALARLRHPNLLRVYDLGEDEEKGVLYFAMDLVLGADGVSRTLADVQPGEADAAQLARWYMQLKSVLDYVHAAGVVHRDVKPSNVLIDAKGNAILGDFGISRFVDGELRRELDIESTMEAERSAAHKVMGSVMYIAPEVRRGEKATAAADAYALGVTFYRLLTGIWYEPGPVAESLLSEFGQGWKTALVRLLSDNPAERLPVPTVKLAATAVKSRWPLVTAAVAVFLLAAGAVLFFARGRLSLRVVTDALHQDVVPEAQAAPSVKYSFDRFFPLHKEDWRQ